MKCLVVIAAAALAAGCAAAPPPRAGQKADPPNQAAEVKAREYREAIARNEKIAAENPKTDSGAEALYQVAYIRTAYDNPQKDYALALQGFEELIRKFPSSRRIPEARTWRAVLKTVIDLRTENTHLNQVIDQLKKIDIHHEEQRAQ